MQVMNTPRNERTCDVWLRSKVAENRNETTENETNTEGRSVQTCLAFACTRGKEIYDRTIMWLTKRMCRFGERMEHIK